MSNQADAERRVGVDEYATLIGARLIDFFNETAPWQRRLWDVGTCMLLDEVVEAVGWRAKGVLSASALSWLVRDAERIIGRDPAAGDRVVKTHLRSALKGVLAPGTRSLRSLTTLSSVIQEGYLDRWANLVATTPSPERLARAVAAHLLDRGYSMPFLHRWARDHMRAQTSLIDLMRSAIELAGAPQETFEVLLPFTSVPGAGTHLTGPNTSWRDASEVQHWLAEHAGAPAGVRQSGGFLYTFSEQDPVAAAYRGARRVDRILARSTLAAAHARRPEPEGRIWVKGLMKPIRLPHASRSGLVKSLVVESRLYDVLQTTDLDDALELLAAMNTGAPGPAIASGWAAIESLLVSPTDPEDSTEGRGAVAADRVALLVAGSWPRGDLTALSYRHAPKAPDIVSKQLAIAEGNRERARIVGNALATGRPLELRDPSDKAASARMTKLMTAPRPTLADVEAHVGTAMRRLYRQRNIVMHGGSTNTLTLEATLRTCSSLVGAALDRITHARLTDQLDALALVTRAQIGMSRLGSDTPIHVVDLLE